MSSAIGRWMNSPTGPRYIHFWAPAMKWALVIAGLADYNRPAEKLSVSQSSALAATGLIWTRYSTQIVPVNYSLMTVNLFLAGTGLYQLYRIYDYKQSLEAKQKSV
ncbi:hypothetical protein MIR68_001245 [Amoeboaphelidium protococcarum]|nr:hypothetical protein MIR68_004723 [Amoeboaphelidium protococcarum]KAI3640367.1 hypothetical protein MIR68_001245 [Amoeboaphelidium protococcarum]KAI3647790.1 hypothetical protein MP228_008011 [Amoeboaphelidium protococcarum]KAI3653488.1 hypothetical protein MP228_001435 [Amoeboaphelidium protococcarum]